jgi:hypothetical protein
VTEQIPTSSIKRKTVNDISTYEFCAVLDGLPLVASTINIATIDLIDLYKSVVMTVHASGMSSAGNAYATVGEYLVTNINGAITQQTISETFIGPAGGEMNIQGVDLTNNEFGIYVSKNAAASGDTLRAVYNVKLLVSGATTSDYASTLTLNLHQ